MEIRDATSVISFRWALEDDCLKKEDFIELFTHVCSLTHTLYIHSVTS